MAYLFKYLFLYTVLFKIFSVLQVKFCCFPSGNCSAWKNRCQVIHSCFHLGHSCPPAAGCHPLPVCRARTDTGRVSLSLRPGVVVILRHALASLRRARSCVG
ncbi:hypothetical protein BW081_19145 [Salmonella enterica]|nr:hypothetical protein [Salmonella enterica]EBN0692555.1 hypothetical protein [Salmonella enterica]EDO5951072.1 hypothetical protein [Salmonella enterica]